MPEKVEYFLVTIGIYEGRHFVWLNMDSAVYVNVGNQKKCTNICRNTDCPFFNEYFTFEFTTTLHKLMDKNIILTVIKPSTVWTSRKVLGCVTLDISTVWKQPHHQFYQKWAILSPPVSDAGGTACGYLKVDINILKKGESPKIPHFVDTDEIESNLLLPDGVAFDRQRANYVFNIYRGDSLCKEKYVNSLCCHPGCKESPTSHVEILFAGLKAQTSVKKNNPNPEWNESLILTEYFPPLYQRITIKLHFAETLHSTFSEHDINLRAISNDGENGFLPTFGPTFVDFYSKGNSHEEFVGKILMSISTELQTNEMSMKTSTKLEHILGFSEVRFWKKESLFLFGVIFETNLINKKFSNDTINFELGFGSASKKCGSNRTPPKIPVTLDKKYWFLNYGNIKPCAFISTSGVDFRRRLYNSNIVLKMIEETKSKFNAILLKEKSKSYESNVNAMVLDIFDFVSTSCSKFQDIVKRNCDTYETELDKLWKTHCLREMENIKKEINLNFNKKSETANFKLVQEVLSRLELLCNDAQRCWPNVYLTMIYGNKKVGYLKFDPQDIIYSVVKEESGKNCAKIQSKFLHFDKSTNLTLFSTVACNLDVFLWLGLERHTDTCMSLLPQGFEVSFDQSPEKLPISVVSKETHYFQCKAHLYQAKLLPGFDRSGLSDPFVRATVTKRSRDTQVIKMSLNPIWDQTLIFKDLPIYGTKSHIKTYPPKIIMELYDQDRFNRMDFIGRCMFSPLIKFKEDPYTAPNFPPQLRWFNVNNNEHVFGEILATAELLEQSETNASKIDLNVVKMIKIPEDIRPEVTQYRIEVVFWGLRNLQKVSLLSITKAKIIMECGDVLLNSDTLGDVQTNLNFSKSSHYIDVSLPGKFEYAPAISIKMFDCRSFGRNILAGTHLVSLQNIFYEPLTETERMDAIHEHDQSIKRRYSISKINEKRFKNLRGTMSETKPLLSEDENKKKKKWISSCHKPRSNKKEVEKPEKIKKSPSLGWRGVFKKMNFKKRGNEKNEAVEFTEVEDEKDFDWWTRFYASTTSTEGQIQEKSGPNKSKHCPLKIYPNELELQNEFNGFTDILQSFEFYKGKRSGDETIDSANITGLFKGALKMYKWPIQDDKEYVLENGLLLSKGIFQKFPSNDPFKFLVRVYCVRCLNLRPKDASGTSDPYIVITMDNQAIKDRNNYISKQVNPLFGRCFELTGVFSQNQTITVSLWDFDVGFSDDLIGETKIDLENRFYSKHRARCGLASEYHDKGYLAWRDYEKPSKILGNICVYNRLELPVFKDDCVEVAGKTFYYLSPDQTATALSNSEKPNSVGRELLALTALHNWSSVPLLGCSLVPEHVETRSLYHPAKIGVEQGKIQLWVDIFPSHNFQPPPMVDIKPRIPVLYELRIIIWNTEAVILDEQDFLSGEKTSDIYLTGWVINPEEAQRTDIHYRSLTGEGNFNWRFIFRFKYLSAENKIVFVKKATTFSVDATEYKVPCRLNIQVWDNDIISADDFLGNLNLELARLPRGSKTPKACTLKILSPENPKINLFKVKRTRGWWPFSGYDKKTKNVILAGKLEAEFELITAEDAEKNPVGLKRDKPQPLPPPNRPETSFSGLWHPLKALNLLTKRFRWKILTWTFLILLICFLLRAFYSLSTNYVKKVLHV